VRIQHIEKRLLSTTLDRAKKQKKPTSKRAQSEKIDQCKESIEKDKWDTEAWTVSRLQYSETRSSVIALILTIVFCLDFIL